MHWSQTESSKWSCNRLSRRLGQPRNQSVKYTLCAKLTEACVCPKAKPAPLTPPLTAPLSPTAAPRRHSITLLPGNAPRNLHPDPSAEPVRVPFFPSPRNRAAKRSEARAARSARFYASRSPGLPARKDRAPLLGCRRARHTCRMSFQDAASCPVRPHRQAIDACVPIEEVCLGAAHRGSRRIAPAPARRVRERPARRPLPSTSAPAVDHAAALWQLCCRIGCTTTVACQRVGCSHTSSICRAVECTGF